MKTRASCLQKRIFQLNSLARKSVNSLFLLVNVNDIEGFPAAKHPYSWIPIA